MKKKLTSILLLCMMFVTFTLPVSASRTASEKIQPGRQECGICGKMTLRTVKLSTHEVGPVPAKEQQGLLQGDNMVWETYTTYQYQCSTCEYKSGMWETLSVEQNDMDIID